MQRVKKQYKDMFDFAVGPMFQSAPDGTLLNANASLAVLLGYNSATELLGVNVPQTLYVNPEDRNRLADVLNQQGSCHGIEFHLKTKKGDVITVREYSRAIHNSAGEVVMYEGILEDVTRKKEQQEKLDQYYKALRTSQENLAKVNAEKDKMVATLSHDLRSPFNSILGFCDILLSEADQLTPEERHEFISYIKESAQQQLALVNNLLDWSRFTTGRSKKKIENLDLSEIIKHSVAAHLGTAKQKGIALSSTVSNAFPLKGDGQQLIQVFNNLISNALKFTPAGGAIEIALTEMKPEEVTVAVRDSGEGIPPEDMLKLFKIDEKYTRPGLAGEKGTGFGLPLCKEIVESHGGSIRAESIVGRGTTFHVTLPLSVEGATSSEVVLVVDDNKGVRVLHAKFVKRALPHVTVIEAADGHEAVELAQRHRPRLIVADYSMPVMNGFEMLNALRRESRTKQIPVLIVTGEDSKSSTEALRLAGAVDVLRKPVTLSQLEEVLKKYIFV
jgi:PAS domain S-box-containing protein